MDDNEWNKENERYSNFLETYELPKRFSTITEISCENVNSGEESTGQNSVSPQNTCSSHRERNDAKQSIYNRLQSRRRSTLICSRQTQRMKLGNGGFSRGGQHLRDSRRKTAETLKARQKNSLILQDVENIKDTVAGTKKRVHFAVETDPQLLISRNERKPVAAHESSKFDALTRRNQRFSFKLPTRREQTVHSANVCGESDTVYSNGSSDIGISAEQKKSEQNEVKQLDTSTGKAVVGGGDKSSLLLHLENSGLKLRLKSRKANVVATTKVGI